VAAVEIFTAMGRWLGRGIASLAAALDPSVVVIGGGVSEAGDLLLDPARAAFERALPGRGHRPLAEIKVAQLGEDAGIVGAADLARESGQNAAFTRRRRRRRRLGRPVLVRSYAARVWRSL
jgi:glucokinase